MAKECLILVRVRLKKNGDFSCTCEQIYLSNIFDRFNTKFHSSWSYNKIKNKVIPSNSGCFSEILLFCNCFALFFEAPPGGQPWNCRPARHTNDSNQNCF